MYRDGKYLRPYIVGQGFILFIAGMALIAKLEDTVPSPLWFVATIILLAVSIAVPISWERAE